MSTDFLSHNVEETLSFARRLAEKEFEKGSVILLKGSVGAGKTSFVRGFVSGMGPGRPCHQSDFHADE